VDALGLGWLMGGMRSVYRLVGLYRPRPRNAQAVLIYGAGRSGQLVLRELQQNTLRGLHPVGFIDDDADLFDRVIDGVPVLGGSQSLPDILNQQAIKVVVISSKAIADFSLRRVLHLCKDKGITVLRSEFQFRPVAWDQSERMEGALVSTGTFGRDRQPAARRSGESVHSLSKAGK
jgi:UDP-GlcNAc:undecaprenyl-phosphate GlcNAc-1-phosphate transferase